jgi:hypothetical protein
MHEADPSTDRKIIHTTYRIVILDIPTNVLSHHGTTHLADREVGKAPKKKTRSGFASQGRTRYSYQKKGGGISRSSGRSAH